MMVLMMILHVFRVYLTGGFKNPREFTWVTGFLFSLILRCLCCNICLMRLSSLLGSKPSPFISYAFDLVKVLG